MSGARWPRFAAMLLAAAVVAVVAGCATDATSPAGSAAAPGERAATSVIPRAEVETEQRRRARIRLELAANYYQQGNYNVALEELRRALEVDPGYAAAYGVLGLVYRDLGDRARAEESFQRGLRLSPDDPELNNNYGWFLCQAGKERESLDYFARALKDPLYATPAKPLHNAGICSLRIGDEAAAESYFQRAFQVDPGNPVAMYNLSELYLKRGDLARARFHAQRLLAGFDPTAQILWLALRVEHARGDRDGEASLAAQLRRRFPDSPEAGLLAAGRFGG